MLLNGSAAGYPSIDPLKGSFLMMGFTSCFIIAERLKQREGQLETKLQMHFSLFMYSVDLCIEVLLHTGRRLGLW